MEIQEMTDFNIDEKAEELQTAFHEICYLLALTNTEKDLRAEEDKKAMEEEREAEEQATGIRPADRPTWSPNAFCGVGVADSRLSA